MKTYWDYDEEERAALTDEQVENLLRFEMMEAGVVAPPPLQLLSEEAPKPDTERVYKIMRGGRYQDRESSGIAIRELSVAEAILAAAQKGTAVYVDHDYSVNIDTQAVTTLSIEPADVVTAESLSVHRSALERAKANKEENRKAQESHRKALKAVQDATVNVWSDYRRCKERASQLERVRKTFDQYLKDCDGMRAIALKFLYKAYSKEDIEAALGETGSVEFARP